MTLLGRISEHQGIPSIIGSGFHWAWFDALFMSAFFISNRQYNLMPEIATILVFGFCIPFCIWVMYCSNVVERLIRDNRAVIIFALLGSFGSLLFIVAGIFQNWVLLIIGAVLGGVYAGFSQVGWGATYSQEGAKSATFIVAGSFAIAVLFDIPLLFMIKQASASFFALFPIVSGLCYRALDQELRSYRTRDNMAKPATGTVWRNLRNYLGVSVLLLGALMLVMAGFGYMQHLMSFMTLSSSGSNGGILIQLIRGGVAIFLFIALALFSWRAGVVYRIGLLVMIAGCMLMPFLFDTNTFWVSGAVIIGGYTSFDVLIWVVFSQIAYTESRAPIKTIAIMRLFTAVSYCVGAVLAIFLVGNGETPATFFTEKTVLVGYLMTIATVLLLSSDDIWVLLGGSKYRAAVADDESGLSTQLVSCLGGFGLTARELEIATLLAYGRTQAWIAEYLNISENTVGTHVRHIYQKTGVHNRQQFIDFVAPVISKSPETHDASQRLTKDA